MFQRLRDAFSRGAEIVTGVSLFQGASRQKIDETLSKRFGVDDPDDQQSIVDFARQGIDAARGISNLGESDDIDLATIPENPWLFGDESGGQRGLVVKRVRFEDDPRWYNIRVGIADFTTPDDILSAVSETTEDIIGRYPRAFGGKGQGPHFISEIDWMFAERKF
jgi:hypothetical protein